MDSPVHQALIIGEICLYILRVETGFLIYDFFTGGIFQDKSKIFYNFIFIPESNCSKGFWGTLSVLPMKA